MLIISDRRKDTCSVSNTVKVTYFFIVSGTFQIINKKKDLINEITAVS